MYMAAASQISPPEAFQEEEKFNELISSLPKEDGFPLLPLYRCHNFWYPKRLLLRTRLSKATDNTTTDQKVIVASTPKAGTTWLNALTYAIINRSHLLPNLHQHPLLNNNPHQFVPSLEGLAHNHQNISPVFSVHIPYSTLSRSVNNSNSNCKIVYICRDPKDVVISLWHFLAELYENNGISGASTSAALPFQYVFEMFCAGTSVLGPFWDHVREYWEASLEKPQKVLFLKYEELKRNTIGEVKGLAEFLGYGFTAEEEEQGVVEDVVKLY